MEKAHADVFNILLQILDDGHVTDSQGRKVSFKNAILIMTSNMGSQYIVSGMEKDPQGVKDMVMSQVSQSQKCSVSVTINANAHSLHAYSMLYVMLAEYIHGNGGLMPAWHTVHIAT